MLPAFSTQLLPPIGTMVSVRYRWNGVLRSKVGKAISFGPCSVFFSGHKRPVWLWDDGTETVTVV